MKIPFLKNQNKPLLRDSISRLEIIRKRSDIVAICATNTGFSWLGVNVATWSLFPENTLELPQNYSNSIFSDKELAVFTEAILELGFKTVILSGFPPFYIKIVNNICEHVVIKTIYHGFLSEFSQNLIMQQSFSTIIQMTIQGKIKSVGFVKKGLALSVHKMYNISSFEIILPNPSIASKPVQAKKASIGCFVNSSFRKNIHNQVMAGLMVPDSKVHTFESKELGYLPQERINYHSLMSHDKFLKLVSSMTVNLHVTFSEGMGGQVCAESISNGVPCISADTSSFFDYDLELKNDLVVNGFDDSWHIYRKIEDVMKERESLSIRCIEYAKLLNVKSKEQKKLFLDS